MERTCEYSQCDKTIYYDENRPGRPPKYCCEEHKKAAFLAGETKEKPSEVSTIQHSSPSLMPMGEWCYKGHIFRLTEETAQRGDERVCSVCGRSWVSLDTIHFDCPEHLIYNPQDKIPNYLVTRLFLLERGYWPTKGEPLPKPDAEIRQTNQNGEDLPTCLYDLRKIIPGESIPPDTETS